jgi:iron complex outermembrane receptor protein
MGRDVDNALPFAYIFLERRGGGVRASWSGGLAERIALTAGMDAEFARDDRREFNNESGQAGSNVQRDQVERVLALGPFAQANVRFSPAVELTAGLRYDAVRFETEDRFLQDGRDDAGERTLSSLSPMIGVTWQMVPDASLYANFATAFQTPTTTELINAPPPAGQPCCPGGFNADLDPQHARSAEIGARGRIGQRIDFDVALYHMNVDNTIVPFQVEGVDGREFFRNAGETRHRGVELSAMTTFGRHSVHAAYTFNDFVFVDDGNASTDFEDNRLPGVPRHNLFGGIRLGLLEGVRLDLDAQHTGEQATEDSNDPAFLNESSTVFDARLLVRLSVGGWDANPFIALNNITDERYNSSVVVNAVGRRYFEPAPGRNLYLGLSLASPGWAPR